MRDLDLWRKGAWTVLGTAAVFLLLYGGLSIRQSKPVPWEGEERSLSLTASQPAAPGEDDGRLNVLICGVDDTRYLTDVILLASLGEETGEVSVLQIPRDTYVGTDLVPTGKINALYGQKDGGIQALEAQVEELTGLSVDRYVTVTLEGVRAIVDDLGGIPMTLAEPIDYLPGKSLSAGEHLLTGEQAEWLIRYREGYATGDIGRMETQKEFLAAALETVHDKGRSQAIGALVRNYSQVETDMPLAQMVSMGRRVFDLGTDSISFHLLPGEGEMVEGYAVYLPDRDALSQLITQYFASGSSPDPEKGAVP